MLFTFRWFVVGVVSFLLAPPTLAFSRGASKSSCQEMIPGHIRAQPQDPDQSHVTLRTSTSSYLPGQLVTVTVRSSRDFMGFLLQARSVEGRMKSGVRSMGLGPVLVGGSWVLTPPGTHTLRCFTAGDTLTHSDKQLKRNLSFVWKAPDVPMGDVKFYVTVVQSYFVHWAGIESTVVRDGSRSLWSGTNNMRTDEGNSVFTQEDEVTDSPAVQSFLGSNGLKGGTTSPSITLRLPTTTKRRPTTNEKSQETLTEVAQQVLEKQSQATFTSLKVQNKTNLEVDQVKNENDTEKNNSLTSVSPSSVQKDGTNLSEKAGATTNSGTQSFTSWEQLTEVTHPGVDKNGFATLAYLGVEHPTDQEGNEKTSHQTFKFLQNLIKGKETAGFFSGEDPAATQEPSILTKPTAPVLVNFSLGTFGVATVAESSATVSSEALPNLESETESYSASGSPSSGTEEPSPTKLVPFVASLSSLDTKGMEGLTTFSPNITGQKSTSPSTNASLVKDDGDIEGNETNLNNSIHPTVSKTTDSVVSPTIATEAMLSTNHRSYVTNPSRSTFQDPRGAITESLETKRNQSESQKSPNEDGTRGQSILWLPKLFHQIQTSTTKPHLGSQSGTSPIIFTTKAMAQTSLKLVFPSKSPSLQSNPTETLKHLPDKTLSVQELQDVTSLPQTQPENGPPERLLAVPLSVTPRPKPWTSDLQTSPQTESTQTEGKTDSQSDLQKVLSVSPTSWLKPSALKVNPKGLATTQSTTLPRSINPMTVTSSSNPIFTTHKAKKVKDLWSEAKTKTISPVFASVSPSSPSPVSVSTHLSSTHALPGSSLGHPSSTTTLYPNKRSPQTSSSSSSSPDPSTRRNGLKTVPVLPDLPSPSPMATPPNPPSVQNTKTSAKPSSNSFHFTSTSAPLTPSAVTLLTSNTTSTNSVSSSSLGSSSFQSTPSYPEPSPAPRRSTYNATTTTSSRQQLTPGQKLLIQNHITSSDPEPKHNQPSPRTVVHQNPEPHPNLDSNIKPKLKPNLPNSNPKPNHPSNPSLTPGKDGKYPDIIPRHSAWELGMLLGCSAGLGMVLVVGVRYMYRQACGKRTEVTLNDREREYGRGERGLIHVQECGDLVRVRRIRDNSFVLLAEYDLLASPGD